MFPQDAGNEAVKKVIGTNPEKASSLERLTLYAYVVFLQNGEVITDTQQLVRILQNVLVPRLKAHTDVTVPERPPVFTPDYTKNGFTQHADRALARLAAAEFHKDGYIAADSAEAQELFKKREAAFSITSPGFKEFLNLLKVNKQLLELISKRKYGVAGAPIAGLIVLEGLFVGADHFELLPEASLPYQFSLLALAAVQAYYSFSQTLAIGDLTPDVSNHQKLEWTVDGEEQTRTEKMLCTYSERALWASAIAFCLPLLLFYGAQFLPRFGKDPESFSSPMQLAESSFSAIANEAFDPTKTENIPTHEVSGQTETVYWLDSYCYQNFFRGWQRCGIEYEDTTSELPVSRVRSLAEFSQAIEKSVADGYLVRRNIDFSDVTYQIPLYYEPVEVLVVSPGTYDVAATWYLNNGVEVVYHTNQDGGEPERTNPTTETAVVYKKIETALGSQNIHVFQTEEEARTTSDNLSSTPVFDGAFISEYDFAEPRLKELAPLYVEALALKNQNVPTAEILEILTARLTAMGIKYGTAAFDGTKLNETTVAEKLAELVGRTPEGKLVYPYWDCDQYSYVIQKIALAAGLDVHKQQGHLDTAATPYGGYPSTLHQWLLFREDPTAAWQVFDATKIVPLGISSNPTENDVSEPTGVDLRSLLEREQTEQTILLSIAAACIAGATGFAYNRKRSAGIEKRTQNLEQQFTATVERFNQELAQASPAAVRAVTSTLRSVLGVVDISPQRYSQQTKVAAGWYSLRGKKVDGVRISGELEPTPENAELLAEEFYLWATSTEKQQPHLAQNTQQRIAAVTHDLQATGRSITKNRHFTKAALTATFKGIFQGTEFDPRRKKLQKGLKHVLAVLHDTQEENGETLDPAFTEAVGLLEKAAALFEFDYRKA